MTNKLWTLVGSGYVCFALISAVAATSPSPTLLVNQPPIVAQAHQSSFGCGERLHLADENPRRDLWLCIWSTRNCAACVRQEAEIPALESAGYNVILRKAPAPRFVKSFPATIVTRGSPTGPRVDTWAGFKTLTEIDARLKIGEETEEEVENPDYDIFTPQTNIRIATIVAWIDGSETSRQQLKEFRKLRKLDFRVNVHIIDIGQVAPYIILLDIRRRPPPVIAIWNRFVTAEEILDALP